MDKKILIDALQAKHTRIAITNNGNVDGYEFENINKKQLKGNIYLGKISRIEPSLQAAFVDFGNERHGFLAFNDIQSEYYQLPQSDKDILKQEEEEIREELNKVTEKIDENENTSNSE
ncbi:MAG: S1 RNA-binding domain-containing protein, partial [Pelagibacteraceae bacterium]